MADEEEVRFVHEGRRDLERCDLRDAKFTEIELSGARFANAHLSGTIFERCNLSGTDFRAAQMNRTKFIDCVLSDAKFNGAHMGTDFSGSDLSGARMEGIFKRCNFDQCDLSGTDFSRSSFGDLSSFENVTFDEATDFEGAKGLRALSRLAVFQNFKYERGIFSRIGTPESTRKEVNQSSPVVVSDPEAIAQKIRRNAGNVRLMVASLALAIDEQLADLSIPNEPEALDRYNAYVGIMQQVRDGLAAISVCIEQTPGDSADFNKAATIVATLQEKVGGWLSTNSETVTAYGMKTGLLGAGYAFLSLCGAPALPAFTALAFMLEGKTLVDSFRYTKKSDDG